MDYNFRVRAGTEEVATRQQIPAERLKIVNLAVKNDPDGLIFIGHWLAATCQIDDGQPAVAQTGVAVQMYSVAVRPSMKEGGKHALDVILRHLRRRIKDQFSRYAAHNIIPLSEVPPG
jgi:hypothetical protein